MKKQPKLVHVATVPEFFWSFFQGQIEYMVRNGFEVHLVCSEGELCSELRKWPVRVHTMEIVRAIAPFRDILAILMMVKLFRRISPDIVHAHTSKAGLMAMIAAALAHVPVRVFTIHGFRWAGIRGFSRLLIKTSNRLTCMLADRVCCVSGSNLEVGISEGICEPLTSGVLCRGSVNGVDALGRFNPENYPDRAALLTELGIPPDSMIFGFVGRIVRDKGIEELFRAWLSIREAYPDTRLMLVGKTESGDPVPLKTIAAFHDDPRVHMAGFQTDIPKYLAAMDVLLLPSYREGFPVTPLEASAMELPVIATRIPGCVDAVVDEETGILIKPRDADALAGAMGRFLDDRPLMDKMGKNGRHHVLEHFQPEKIWSALLDEYTDLLSDRGGPFRTRQSSQKIMKRILDFFVAALGLIFLSPLYLCISFLVLVTLGTPVLFRDKRAGKGQRPFWFYKFRTMTNDRDSRGNLLPDNRRLISLGRFFRASSLDELPQLINVLKGEMSLVGPRPLPMKYLHRYTLRQSMRHHVKPGITGWVAVNYRGRDKTWEEKLDQDIWYVEHWSFGLDMKIIVLTLLTLFRKPAINRSGETTSEEFLGVKE